MREVLLTAGRNGKAKKNSMRHLCKKAFHQKEDSRQAIEALMRKRNYNPETADAKEKQKMMGYLMRKGFSYQDVRNVLQVCE